jgi:drug/metabolite transporter (DMT)-like permease
MSGFWGLCGYVIACKYFPPVVIMNCLLIEPVLGQLIGVYLKIDEPPGALTYVGVILIIIAINIIQKGSAGNKTEKIEN